MASSSIVSFSQQSVDELLFPGDGHRRRRKSSYPRTAIEQAEMLAKKRGGSAVERFLVKPDYAYPNTRMNRDELREEMNKPSASFHDLRLRLDNNGHRKGGGGGEENKRLGY